MSQSFRAEVLEQLRESGSDITQLHGFEFYLYLPSESAARAAAVNVRERHFSAEVVPSADGSTWLCLTTMRIVPEVAPLDEIGKMFEQLASALQGEFDGWESEVIAT
jgi:regulator of RNase E activity RraB